MRLLLQKIYLSLLKRSKVNKNSKSYEGWIKKGFNKSPIVSFIIQSHNKSLEVLHIIEKLRQQENIEIIVIDDGSQLVHTRRLSKTLTRGNEFLIRSNDLYENVMYDKAIRFANGDYIVLMQDDDDFTNLAWVEEGLSYFKQYSDMAILGGCGGFDLGINEEEKRVYCLPYKESKQSFRFVNNVNRAPMWINKKLFVKHLKHIDFSLAPFQFDDIDLCLRAWLAGLTVGWYNAGFTSLTAGGMRIWNNEFTRKQAKKNSAKLYDRFYTHKEQINQLVIQRNNRENR